ncbi:hypothetical protein [Aureliella helgolandensis]|uniref:TraB family protein n=1 Tax=Aureliella helgolandensis TaxID=2527968 RepID=A0A518GDF5_9BACT|nr:hypothetical protein [Aureliella helgolandensis]QDV26580.1 hypothetical protein Q31a_49540 [Aureliella helgolandensis]
MARFYRIAKRPLTFSVVALLLACCCGPAHAQVAVAEPNTAIETPPPVSPTAVTPKKEENSDPIEFARVSKEGERPLALQTAVATYAKPGDTDGVTVTLIGAVHIADPEYYQKLNQLFSTFDALLYEMVSDPDAGVPLPEERGASPVSTIQVGMKDALDMTFQLDEVDYQAKNFVHADMSPKEFFDSMNSRKEGVLKMLLRSMGASIAMQSSGKSNDMELLAAMVSGDTLRARRAFAEQMEQMDWQMAALSGEDGKSTLITERNAKAFQILDREIKAGKKKIGIFYGAGHLKDMDQRLREDYRMKRTETTWLDAWKLN